MTAPVRVQKSTSPLSDEAAAPKAAPRPVAARPAPNRPPQVVPEVTAADPVVEPITAPKHIPSTMAEAVALGVEMEAPPVAQRIPFGQRRSRLSAAERPGFNRRWINDYPGRIEQALAGGYSFVKAKDGSPDSRVVDKGMNNAGLRAYLMEIPTDLWTEDQAVKQESLDAVDHQLQNGTFDSKDTEKDNRYVPRDTPIKFNVSRGR